MLWKKTATLLSRNLIYLVFLQSVRFLLTSFLGNKIGDLGAQFKMYHPTFLNPFFLSPTYFLLVNNIGEKVKQSIKISNKNIYL